MTDNLPIVWQSIIPTSLKYVKGVQLSLPYQLLQLQHTSLKRLGHKDAPQP